MADQNQNLLAPVAEDEEQFFSSEVFASAESAVDWDALVTRGNVNNTQRTSTMSKWERDSLYVKFDPLISSSQRDPVVADRSSFIFKMPNVKAPSNKMCPVGLQDSVPDAGDLACDLLNVTVTTGGGDEPVNNREEVLCHGVDSVASPGSQCISSLCNGLSELTFTSSTTNGGGAGSCGDGFNNETVLIATDNDAYDTTVTCSEAVLNSTFTRSPSQCDDDTDKGDYEEMPSFSTPECEEESIKNETLSDIVAPVSFVGDNECGGIDVEASPNPEELEEKEPEPDISATRTHRCRARVSTSDVEGRRGVVSPTVLRRSSEPRAVSSNTATPPAFSSNHAEKMARIEFLKTKLASITKEYEEEQRRERAETLQAEKELVIVVEMLRAKEEEHQRIAEQKKNNGEERDTAIRDLRSMEAAFTRMLMMYEGSKKLQSNLEENIEVLNARAELHKHTIERRRTRDSAASDMVVATIDRMKQDYEEKIKDKEQENVKLKAKLRMAEMKTTKLEAEISQVQIESEKLQSLCNDLIRN